jgi:hypothetical protein
MIATYIEGLSDCCAASSDASVVTMFCPEITFELQRCEDTLC